MHAESIISSMIHTYNCYSTYLDSGNYKKDSYGSKSLIRFNTFFRRLPEAIRFEWTGHGGVVRGDDFNIDSPESTIVGYFDDFGYRWDPRRTFFDGALESPAIKFEFVNEDKAYSKGSSAIVLPLLLPQLHIFSWIDWTGKCAMSDIEQIDHSLCYVIRFDADASKLCTAWIDKKSFLLRQLELREGLTEEDFSYMQEIASGKYKPEVWRETSTAFPK